MMRSAKVRIKEVHRKIRLYKKKHENRFLFCLSVWNMFLLLCIGALSNALQIKGISFVTNGYSAVMLRNEAGAYVLVGICSFVMGAVLTIICIRMKEKKLKEE